MSKRENTAGRLLGAFTEAIDAVGAKSHLVDTLKRVRSEAIPQFESLVEDVDQVLDRAGGIKELLQEMRSKVIDARVVEESEED